MLIPLVVKKDVFHFSQILIQLLYKTIECILAVISQSLLIYFAIFILFRLRKYIFRWSKEWTVEDYGDYLRSCMR